MFEFDPDKDEINRSKHGLPLLVATAIFEGEFVEREDSRYNYGEQRFVATGPIERLDNRIHVATYTWRDGKRRIINVRKANAKEIRKYRRGDA